MGVLGSNRVVDQVELSEYKWVEERITRLSAVLRVLNRVNELIAHEVDRERLTQQVCKLLVKTCAYLSAWALLIDNNNSPLSVAGAGNEQALSILKRMKQGDYPPCVIKDVLEQGEPFICCSSATEQRRGCPLFPTFSDRAVFLGRLESGGRVYGVLAVSIPLEMAANEDEHSLFKRIVSDISYALAKIEAEKERKQIEIALRENEEKYRDLFNNAQVGLFRVRISDGKLLECNDLYAKTMGYDTREQCIAHFVASEHYVNPDDRKQFLRELWETGQATQFVAQIIRKDKSSFWASYSARIYPEAETIEGALTDITKLKQVEEQLEASRKELRDLSTHLQYAREEERKRIAREIHDELGQALTALKMDLSWLDKRLPGGQELLSEKIKSMSKLINMTTQMVRRISTELRPGVLDDLGLVAALEWQAEQFQDATGIKCEVTSMPEDIILSQDLATTIFRISQETLTNTVRHANATRVKVNLKQKAGKLEFEVRDNGRGITEKEVSHSKSLGLIGIRERVHYWGGKVEISGVRGHGTTVRVCIPLDEGRYLNVESAYR